MSNKKTLDDFITEANVIHNNKYIYTKSVYNGSNVKLKITCPIHGEFWQTPSKHLRGQGCPECAKITRAKSNSSSTDGFIEKSKKVHNNKYIYDKTEYIKNSIPVTITCPIHGDFKQRPDKHLIGHGCPKCAGNEEITTEQFIERSIKIHNGKYDYSKSKCNGTHNKTIITCPIHGDFEQTPKEHMKGKGCPICANISKNKKLKLEDKLVIERTKSICNGKYIIPNDFKYVNLKTKIRLICPKHGEWEILPKNLWNGHGCPKCSNTVSKAEEEIYKYVCGLIGEKDVENRNREILDGKELDIYVPKLHIAIEYNGLRWHSEEFNKDKNYHLNKLIKCNEKGIKLIQIFEDEWIERQEIVLRKIKHILGFNDGEKIYARKCEVKEIDKHLAYEFLDKNHIQGSVDSSVALGCFCESKLVGVMLFTQESKDNWNLTRFATDNDTRCIGVAGKLFKAFLTAYNPIYVKSFADRRWTLSEENNVYVHLGFKLADTLRPDYRYVNGQKREHKFGYRKDKLHKKYGVPLEWTERQMTEHLGFYRIYDCGLYRYEWKRKEGD